jgi:cellulose synthase/poly-beta-1,6-N-acetylglucosamine synthase-like glycosyltransferase
MTGISLILQFMLAGVLCVFAVLSAQLIVLGYFRLYRQAPRVRTPLLPDAALPRVLVQLPVCDEGPLAVRVAAAAARLDWPADKLEIQVLDDGRPENHEGLARALASVVPQGSNGVSFKVLRRGRREGFKAGNLAFGLTHSDAPYVAIMDADFVPPTDFLMRMVPALVADQGLAYVQAHQELADTRAGHAARRTFRR